jgi:hypothetical protein
LGVAGAWNIIATDTLYKGTNLSKLLQFSSGGWAKGDSTTLAIACA